MKTIKARIPAIVTADGRWAAQGSYAVKNSDDADWSFIEEMCDFENPAICPMRLWVTVEIQVPEIAEITGSVEI